MTPLLCVVCRVKAALWCAIHTLRERERERRYIPELLLCAHITSDGDCLSAGGHRGSASLHCVVVLLTSSSCVFMLVALARCAVVGLCVCAFVSVCACALVCSCVYVCMCMNMCVCAHVCMYVLMCMYGRVCVLMCACAHVCVCVCARLRPVCPPPQASVV